MISTTVDAKHAQVQLIGTAVHCMRQPSTRAVTRSGKYLCRNSQEQEEHKDAHAHACNSVTAQEVSAMAGRQEGLWTGPFTSHTMLMALQQLASVHNERNTRGPPCFWYVLTVPSVDCWNGMGQGQHHGNVKAATWSPSREEQIYSIHLRSAHRRCNKAGRFLKIFLIIIHSFNDPGCSPSLVLDDLFSLDGHLYVDPWK